MFISKIKLDLKSLQTQARVAGFVDTLMPKIAAIFETEIKTLTPVVTGNLASSIVGQRTGFGTAEVSTNVKYAPYVEFGTKHSHPTSMFRRGAKNALDIGLNFIGSELKKAKL